MHKTVLCFMKNEKMECAYYKQNCRFHSSEEDSDQVACKPVGQMGYCVGFFTLLLSFIFKLDLNWNVF